MKDLSSHILDLINNSLAAEATKVDLEIRESLIENTFLINITDNGRGMNLQSRQKATDCSFTTRKSRNYGLGLPFAKQNAERCDGELRLESTEGKGTTIRLSFRHNHIDRQPLGDIASVIAIVLSQNQVRLSYSHSTDSGEYHFDSASENPDFQPLTPRELMRIKAKIITELERISADKD